jgi:CDP-diacylglycerol pyrophosphatase
MRLPLLLLALAACAPPPEPPDREGLYRQMRACLAETAPAPPCTMVNRPEGYVVIKDDSPAKPDAWLVVPTAPVTGIEDPRALTPPVVAFWSLGWDVGRRLLGRPPQAIGLAINSKPGRTQDLLHIHISCVGPAVRAALAAAPVGPEWAPAPFLKLRGNAYNVRKVASLDPSPFLRLLELPGARADMADQSLGVIGAADGWYLVTDSTEPGVVAEAEALLDQDCR